MFSAGIARLPFPNLARHRRRSPSVAGLAAVVVVVAVLVALVGVPAAAETTEPTDSSAAVTGPVSSANARFVEASYQALLGRDPDAAGLDYQLARIVSGGDQSRQVLAYSLLFSVEGSRQEVQLAYQEILGRLSDAEGESYWTDLLGGRGVLELRVLLLASDEYYLGSGGTNQAWLNALYNEVLDRGIDGPGQAYWLDLLNSGLARASVAGAIYRSDEALNRRAESYYQSAFSRPPTEAERQAAVAVVRATGERHLRAQNWASDEAFEVYLVAAWS